MASFTLFDGSTAARTLVNGESGIVAQAGALVTSLDAITSSGSVDISVLGSVQSSDGNAIDHDGSILDVQIGQNGAVGALKFDTISVRVSSSFYLSNAGYLSSGDDAVDVRQSDGGAIIKIINTGTISGKSDAIVTDSGTGVTRISNFGDINGAAGGIDTLGGDTLLTNYGNIWGESYGYDGSGEVDTVKNFGFIGGGVKTKDGEDVVFNRGNIDFVELGAGNDIFKGRNGSVDGDVKGGSGADTLIGSKSDDDILKGESGSDILKGRGGDDTLLGGGGNDTITGGRGDDSLTGNNGADIFVFGKFQGTDVITDFQNGSDKLDLSAFGFASKAAALAKFYELGSANNNKMAFDYKDTTIIIKGIDMGDLNNADLIV